MSRPVWSLQLYRENKHIAPQPWRDVLDVIGWAVLGFLLLILVVVGMA